MGPDSALLRQFVLRNAPGSFLGCTALPRRQGATQYPTPLNHPLLARLKIRSALEFHQEAK